MSGYAAYRQIVLEHGFSLSSRDIERFVYYADLANETNKADIAALQEQLTTLQSELASAEGVVDVAAKYILLLRQAKYAGAYQIREAAENGLNDAGSIYNKALSAYKANKEG